MLSIKNFLKESQGQEVALVLDSTLKSLEGEGLKVEFGHIGSRTTYALIHNEDNSIEVVGYTFIKDLKYYKENTGKLKALQQAIARKKMSEEGKNHE